MTRAVSYLLALALALTTKGAKLPLIELPVPAPGKVFAVLLTGDGGWRSIDKQIAAELVAAKIPVVGFSTPAYFGVQRTAAEAGAALEQVITTYAVKWQRPSVIVIGYSRGADILPLMLARTSAAVRAQVRLVALLGLEGEIELHYQRHWLPFFRTHETELPVLPEVEKLRGMNLLCIYGSREQHSLCRQLGPSLATVVSLPGGHHFGGHYRQAALAILRQAGR